MIYLNVSAAYSCNQPLLLLVESGHGHTTQIIAVQ